MANEPIKQTIELTSALPRETAQILQEGDALVPDVKPDMAVILKADADVVIEKTEVLSGRVHFTGKLTIKVLYLAKGGERAVNTISAAAQIDDSINIEGLTPDYSVLVCADIANIEYRMMNDRKIGYRAVIEVSAAAEAQNRLEAVTGIEGLPENQIKRSVINFTKTVERKEDRFSVKDEFTIGGGKPGIREVLQASAQIANKEAKAGNGRVNVSGEVLLSVLYKGDDGMLEFIEREMPFNGAIDVPGAKEGHFADAKLKPAEIHAAARPNEDGEDRILDAELIISACVRVTSSEAVSVLEDAYSTEGGLTLEKREARFPRLVCRNKNQYPVKEIVTNPEGSPDMLQILLVSGKPVVDEINLTDDKVCVEGVIHADILYIAESDGQPLCNNKAVIPFRQTIETKGAGRNMDVSLDASIDHTGFNMLSGREVELRFLLSFNTQVIERGEGCIAADVRINPYDESELDKMAGIVIYSVRPGESLWDIAKRYNAGVADLAAVNDIEPAAAIYPGQKLVVVKNAG
jgi:LysM repeat protein